MRSLARPLLVVLILAALGVAGFALRSTSSASFSASSQAAPPSNAPSHATADESPAPLPLASPEASAPADVAVSPDTRAQIVARIEAAYTTYRPEALRDLAPYLTHSDPEIRVLARDAVVQLGDAKGAALLRETARKLSDPREAVAMLDAAEFLELPPAAPATGTFKPVARDDRRASAARTNPSL